MATIIVQDTDANVLDVLSIALEMEGFTVCAMKHCDDDILQMIKVARPHVVMLDYKMDGKACIEVCRKIKVKYPHLPVLALSCNSNIHEQFSVAGFDDYIPKPFDLDLLYSVLRNHIPNSEQVS